MNSNNPLVSGKIKNYKFSQNAFLSKEVSISLSEEYGLNYTSLVKAGDSVQEGEIIAKAVNGEDTSYIHASLPGKVLDIAPSYSPDGKHDYAIKIKFGGSLSYLGKKVIESKIEDLTPDVITQTLIDKGVINTFDISKPANLGLQIKNNKQKRNLVIRMYDEDPYRITDSLITKFYLNEIVKAAKVLARAMKANCIFFAIDQKIEDKNLFYSLDLPQYHVLEMNLNRYPCGTPREISSNFRRSQLKKTCSFEVTKKDLYTDSSTMYEVYKAAICSIPSISKKVHFSGNCLNSSCLLDVKIGTPLKDIVSQLGGFYKTPVLIIINGGICGTSVRSLDVPITKYVKSVEFVSNVKKTNCHVYSCVNCGNCRSACPVNLSPDILYNNTINYKHMQKDITTSSSACIECGRCNTVCPARLPLCQIISLLKEKITKNE